MSTYDEEHAYEKIIYEDEIKGIRVVLTVSMFRDVEYIGIRKYYLSYEGEYIPSKEGITIPADLVTLSNLLYGILEISSHEENKEAINKIFKDIVFK